MGEDAGYAQYGYEPELVDPTAVGEDGRPLLVFGDDGGVRGERCRRGAVMVAAYVPLVGTAAAEMFAETVFRVPVRTFGGFADAVETEDFHFWRVRKFRM